MKTIASVDAALERWAEQGFNQSPVRRPKARGLTGLTLKNSASSAPGPSAAAVRARVDRIARRTPEVMVRISGGGRGMRHIRAHLSYISRNGQLPVHDQDGNSHHGKDELAELGTDMQLGGFPVSEVSPWREAYNIILSMPEGTDARGLHRAAARFAAEEFKGHQYALVLHSYDTDINKDPARHPHVHLCVKAMGEDGRRLNPRKQDLQRWRERFAGHLREHGIDATASSRLERLRRQRGQKQGVYHKLQRGEPTPAIGVGSAGDDQLARALKLERSMNERYRDLARILVGSPDVQDWALVAALGPALQASRADIARPGPGRGQGRQPDGEVRRK